MASPRLFRDLLQCWLQRAELREAHLPFIVVVFLDVGFRIEGSFGTLGKQSCLKLLNLFVVSCSVLAQAPDTTLEASLPWVVESARIKDLQMFVQLYMHMHIHTHIRIHRHIHTYRERGKGDKEIERERERMREGQRDRKTERERERER